METVYTEAEWVRHMQRNGKKIFLRWMKRELKLWFGAFTMIMIILAFVTIAGMIANIIR